MTVICQIADNNISIVKNNSKWHLELVSFSSASYSGNYDKVPTNGIQKWLVSNGVFIKL